jgi:hypothetical protein
MRVHACTWLKGVSSTGLKLQLSVAEQRVQITVAHLTTKA